VSVYTRPYDPDRPLVCLDETTKQLTKETRTPVPMKKGQAAWVDYEYERNGTSVPLPVYLAHGLDRNGRLAALVDARLLLGINTDPLPPQNEPALHLGDHAQHRHQDAVGIGRGAELGLEDARPGPLLSEFIDEIEYIPGRADRASPRPIRHRAG
jgi:hypothetical protein